MTEPASFVRVLTSQINDALSPPKNILLHPWYEVKKHILKGTNQSFKTSHRLNFAHVQLPLLSMQMHRQVPLSGHISAPHVSAGAATSSSLKQQGHSCRTTKPLKV